MKMLHQTNHSALEEIVCFELGSGQPPWVGSTASLEIDRDAICRLVTDGLIELKETNNKSYISGIDRVGLIKLPSGRRLVIRSKIENIVLLDWLAFLGDFPPLGVWLNDVGITTGNDFHACIARLFLREMEKLTRLHLRKGYTLCFSNSPIIRGKVMMTKLLRNLHQLPCIPQRYKTRSLNTHHNMVLALALDKIPLLLLGSKIEERKLLANIRNLWADISREINDPGYIFNELLFSCPPGYRPALQLARIILIGAEINPESGFGGQAFTLSLSSVWERSLRRMIEQTSTETGWISSPSSSRTRKWDDSIGLNDPTRWMTADVMATKREKCWILDAKYKRAFGTESRVDRFQMCAYAIAFNADRVTLAYPLAEIGWDRRTLLETIVGTKQVIIDSINLPMSAGPEQCKEALVEVCDYPFRSPISG